VIGEIIPCPLLPTLFIFYPRPGQLPAYASDFSHGFLLLLGKKGVSKTLFKTFFILQLKY
jgi:hypothetical protein